MASTPRQCLGVAGNNCNFFPAKNKDSYMLCTNCRGESSIAADD